MKYKRLNKTIQITSNFTRLKKATLDSNGNPVNPDSYYHIVSTGYGVLTDRRSWSTDATDAMHMLGQYVDSWINVLSSSGFDNAVAVPSQDVDPQWSSIYTGNTKICRLKKAYTLDHPFVQDVINSWINYNQTSGDSLDIQYDNVGFDLLYQLDLSLDDAATAFAKIFNTNFSGAIFELSQIQNKYPGM